MEAKTIAQLTFATEGPFILISLVDVDGQNMSLMIPAAAVEELSLTHNPNDPHDTSWRLIMMVGGRAFFQITGHDTTIRSGKYMFTIEVL